MMKLYYMLLFSLLMLSCEKKKEEVTISKYYPEFNINSASKALEIAEKIQNNQTIDDNDWENLFDSDGYKNYLIYNDSLRKKQLIKEAMLTVFNDNKKAKLDSLLLSPVELGPSYFKLSMLNNFYDIKSNFQDYKAFLKNFNSQKVIKEADSLARMYIPKSDWATLPKLYPVYMVSVDQDGKVMEGSIIIDLNLTYQLSNEGVVKFIAHEFHHNYRQLKAKKYKHPLMLQINKIHQEGVADVIDKDKPPLESLLSLPKSLVDMYNTDYLKAPKNLKKLDSLSRLYSTKKINESELSEQLNNIVRFGGHTMGIYMSFLINENIGKKPLIETYNKPVEFFEIYNKVAKDIEVAYVFSEEFLNTINELK